MPREFSGRMIRLDPVGLFQVFSRSGALRPARVLLWCLLAFCFVPAQGVVAPAECSKEYQLKAVFLWRLGQFTTWPTNAFAGPDSPLVIGVLGPNPFADVLELTVNGETAHARKVIVEYYSRVNEIRNCHVLFIPDSDDRKVSRIIAELRHRSILTVGDSEAFARSTGGMVQFVPGDKKIKLRVNLQALAAADLVLDARVLRAAEVVRTP